MQNLTTEELNDYIVTAPTLVGQPLTPAKKWSRVDIGSIEVYVGDGLYVITLVHHRPRDLDEIKENCSKAEQKVIQYLQSEGFITEEYFYLGLQTLDLQSPFNDVE